MTPLLEQPLVGPFVGSFFVGVAAIVWVQTQHPRAFLRVVGSIVVLAGGSAIEQFVVTPAEVVEGRLFEVRHALEANNVDAVLSFVAQDATDLKDEIRRTMRLASVKKVSIKSNCSRFGPQPSDGRRQVQCDGHTCRRRIGNAGATLDGGALSARKWAMANC